MKSFKCIVEPDSLNFQAILNPTPILASIYTVGYVLYVNSWEKIETVSAY